MENRIYCQKRWKIWDLLFLDTDRETKKRDFWKLLDQRQKFLFNMVEVVAMLPTKTLYLLNQYKLIEGQTRNSGKALLGCLLQQGGVRINNRSLFLLTP